MPTLRPLPPRPSLEYARKEAKALLRRLRTSDPDVLARARDHRIDITDPLRIRLADAQLIIAREHGFASWPRLVRYMRDVERQQHGHEQIHRGVDDCEAQSRRLVAAHRARHPRAGRALAAFVPRFYGLNLDEVFASRVTEEEARLAVARGHGAPSWQVLVERLEHNARTKPGVWERDPILAARDAMAAVDLAALEEVVAAHPGLLDPSEYDVSAGRTLMWFALLQERQLGAAAMKPVMAWLAAHGFDRQSELNLRLCGHGIGPGTAETVQSLLDQGADPNWVAPNGIPVLEHALLRYWNAEAVDVLAAHVHPRKALWIAAGLGDVNGVRGFLDAQGNPTPAARRLRPDFLAVGRSGFGPLLPQASDEEILVEALAVAIVNGRTAVIDYLASRGAPLNSLVFGMPLVTLAVNSPPTADVVACLVKHGADLDQRIDDPNGTPRELVRKLFEQAPHDRWRRGLVAACGMDPDALLAGIDARPRQQPELDSTVKQALLLAREDAARRDQPEVRPENLLIGLLRAVPRPIHFLKDSGRMDVERFRADLADRLAPAQLKDSLPEPPMHADATAAIEAAITTAASQRQERVSDLHLLYALTGLDGDPLSSLLAGYGASPTKLHADLGAWLLLPSE